MRLAYGALTPAKDPDTPTELRPGRLLSRCEVEYT